MSRTHPPQGLLKPGPQSEEERLLRFGTTLFQRLIGEIDLSVMGTLNEEDHLIEIVCMQDVLLFKQTGVDEGRDAQDDCTSTGIRPKCPESLEAAGEALPVQPCERRILGGLHAMEARR